MKMYACVFVCVCGGGRWEEVPNQWRRCVKDPIVTWGQRHLYMAGAQGALENEVEMADGGRLKY